MQADRGWLGPRRAGGRTEPETRNGKNKGGKTKGANASESRQIGRARSCRKAKTYCEDLRRCPAKFVGGGPAGSEVLAGGGSALRRWMADGGGEV